MNKKIQEFKDYKITKTPKKMPPILLESPYYPRFLELFKTCPTVTAIYKALTAEGCSINITTLQDACIFLKNTRQIPEASVVVKEHLQQVSRLAVALQESNISFGDIIDRRIALFNFYVDRRKELLKRTKATENLGQFKHAILDIYEELNQLEASANDKGTIALNLEKLSVIKQKLDNLDILITEHYPASDHKMDVENTILAYTKSIDELYRYIETWTSKYDINHYVEIVAKKVAKASIESFGSLLKDNKDAQKTIEVFQKKMDSLLLEFKSMGLNTNDR